MKNFKIMKPNLESLKKNKSVESVLQFGSSLRRKDYRDIDLCVFSSRKLSFQEKLSLIRPLPEKYDISFYDELPINLKKEVLSTGKVLFTRDYLTLLRRIPYIEREYVRYSAFLKDYHQKRMEAI